MYALADYGMMIANRERTDAHVRALEQTVKPVSVVVDIGTGTGIFALLAARLGARRVFAIEPSNVIQVAREIAAANGLAGAIEFIQDLSTRVTLPEPADVIVSDLRGVLPFHQDHLPSIVDARQRLLAPGGVLIPQSDRLWGAVVEAPDLYEPVACWQNGYRFDMGPAQRIGCNAWRKGRVSPEQLLVSAQRLGVIDYRSVQAPDFSASVHWQAQREGTGHGLLVWFDSTLTEGVEISNAPGAPELIYGSAFFPWPAPVSLTPGDRISALWGANLSGDSYIFRWETRVLDVRDPGRVKADFRQSTFFGEPVAPASLRKRASNNRPKLDEDGQIDRLILDLMDGDTVSEQIARRVQERFPARFAKWQAALARVGELSLRYSR